jgi:two-component system sensor histidine kinase KdpD
VRTRPGADEGGVPDDDALGALLAMLGHELRTPLQVISGFADLLLSEQPGPLAPEQRHCLEELRRSCDRLGRFIDELGVMERRLGAAWPVRPERASLAQLADGVAAATKPLLDRRRQTLRVCVAAGAAQGWFDPARVEQVLQNLIANASRYGPEEGRIDLAAEHVEGPLGAALEVSVTDDGPGVPAADRERVFEPGLRLAPEREPAGLGVGLAICRAIVTAHGGSIRAEAAPGRGARFVFTLPCAPQRVASCVPPGGASCVPGADT